jgi:hypothetical protein
VTYFDRMAEFPLGPYRKVRHFDPFVVFLRQGQRRLGIRWQRAQELIHLGRLEAERGRELPQNRPELPVQGEYSLRKKVGHTGSRLVATTA